MKYSFIKMQGCGNDFLVFDQMKEEDPVGFRKHEVQFLCDRHYGLGADGLVVLTRGGDKSHCLWKFFNNDGSVAEMCGNAARCAIRFLSDHYFPNEEVISVETLAGVIKGKINLELGGVEVTLFSSGETKPVVQEKLIRSADEVFRCHIINTGVPHAVIEVKEILDYPISQVGKIILNHPAFEPDKTNVTFFQQKMGPQIRATTYERGVERETLACGTGAAAAALVYSDLYMTPPPISVEMPGGTIVVDESPVAKRLLLRAEAEYVSVIQLDEIPNEFERRFPFEGRAL